jgi:hypothetical protein
VSRGAVIDGEREYTLGLTPYGRVVRRDIKSHESHEERSRARRYEHSRRG